MPNTALSKGFLISFEGLEGSGKSTQINLLSNHLKEIGFSVLLTREPGGTALAEALRSLLLSHTHQKLSARSELLLLLAGRSDHIEQVIAPALARKQVVIVDRFIDASFAYQGYGRQMGGDFVKNLHETLGLWLTPNRSIFLDLSLQSSFERISVRSNNSPDRIESESEAFFARVREGYRTMAQNEPQRYCVFDASLEANALHKQIHTQILQDLYEYIIS